MIVECCSQERSYSQFYGLIGERFSKLNRVWCENFEEAFASYYDTIHRYETNRLRNIARFFGHLLASDSISWAVLSVVKMNEDDTTSSSRIFIKILMQEMMEEMGLVKLTARFKDSTLAEHFTQLFPLDNPKNTRFSINYFTSIGLGAVTEAMREHLKVSFFFRVPRVRRHVPSRLAACLSTHHPYCLRVLLTMAYRYPPYSASPYDYQNAPQLIMAQRRAAMGDITSSDSELDSYTDTSDTSTSSSSSYYSRGRGRSRHYSRSRSRSGYRRSRSRSIIGSIANGFRRSLSPRRGGLIGSVMRRARSRSIIRRLSRSPYHSIGRAVSRSFSRGRRYPYSRSRSRSRSWYGGSRSRSRHGYDDDYDYDYDRGRRHWSRSHSPGYYGGQHSYSRSLSPPPPVRYIAPPNAGIPPPLSHMPSIASDIRYSNRHSFSPHEPPY